MEKVIYLACCGDFESPNLLSAVCNFFIKNTDKDNIEFIAPFGGKNGDIICRNYVIKNKFKHTFLKPSQMDKPDTLNRCTNAIVFDNGKSKGISISMKLLPKYVKGKIVEVHTHLNELSIYQLGKDIISKKYVMDNGVLKIL